MPRMPSGVTSRGFTTSGGADCHTSSRASSCQSQFTSVTVTLALSAGRLRMGSRWGRSSLPGLNAGMRCAMPPCCAYGSSCSSSSMIGKLVESRGCARRQYCFLHASRASIGPLVSCSPRRFCLQAVRAPALARRARSTWMHFCRQESGAGVNTLVRGNGGAVVAPAVQVEAIIEEVAEVRARHHPRRLLRVAIAVKRHSLQHLEAKDVAVAERKELFVLRLWCCNTLTAAMCDG